MGSFEKQLATFLRRRRGEQTYEQFGKLLGIKKSTVFKLENASTSPKLKTIEQICARLKCNVSDIFLDQF